MAITRGNYKLADDVHHSGFTFAHLFILFVHVFICNECKNVTRTVSQIDIIRIERLDMLRGYSILALMDSDLITVKKINGETFLSASTTNKR